MRVRYTKNNGILHIYIGKYHVLLSREAGIIRSEGSGNDHWIWGWR